MPETMGRVYKLLFAFLKDARGLYSCSWLMQRILDFQPLRAFIFFPNQLRFCFRSKTSANDKRDYTCMTKLVSLIVVQSSGEWCRNEICRFLFSYFRKICDSCMRAVWRCRHNPCDFCLHFQFWT